MIRATAKYSRFNVVAVLSDGRTITTQTDSVTEAARRVVEWKSDSFYMSGNVKVIRVFVGNDDVGLLEYTATEVDELAGGA